MFSRKLINTGSILIAIVLFTTSCQEVIDIELKNSDRRYVIEGSLTLGTDQSTVRVTRTTSYFSSQPPQPVTNATVEITMPDGEIETMTHLGGGFYKAIDLNIVESSEYKLKVEVEDETFVATTYMNAPVIIDTLDAEYQEGFFGEPGSYNVFITFQDAPGPNHYKVRTFLNGELMNQSDDIQIFDDRFSDGTIIRIPVFNSTFDIGDTVEVDLQSIDRKIYKFYETFTAIAGSGAGSPFSAAPANPETNITGGALGYFGAFTSNRKTIIIQE